MNKRTMKTRTMKSKSTTMTVTRGGTIRSGSLIWRTKTKTIKMKMKLMTTDKTREGKEIQSRTSMTKIIKTILTTKGRIRGASRTGNRSPTRKMKTMKTTLTIICRTEGESGTGNQSPTTRMRTRMMKKISKIPVAAETVVN